MSTQSMTRAERRQARRIRRFDNPWLNPKLIWGAGLLLAIIVIGIGIAHQFGTVTQTLQCPQQPQI